jgi:hypothetical protein
MADATIGKYHLYPRRYSSKDGKHYAYWWFWWNEEGTRKQAPAGRACGKSGRRRTSLRSGYGVMSCGCGTKRQSLLRPRQYASMTSRKPSSSLEPAPEAPG